MFNHLFLFSLDVITGQVYTCGANYRGNLRSKIIKCNDQKIVVENLYLDCIQLTIIPVLRKLQYTAKIGRFSQILIRQPQLILPNKQLFHIFQNLFYWKPSNSLFNKLFMIDACLKLNYPSICFKLLETCMQREEMFKYQALYCSGFIISPLEKFRMINKERKLMHRFTLLYVFQYHVFFILLRMLKN